MAILFELFVSIFILLSLLIDHHFIFRWVRKKKSTRSASGTSTEGKNDSGYFFVLVEIVFIQIFSVKSIFLIIIQIQILFE